MIREVGKKLRIRVNETRSISCISSAQPCGIRLSAEELGVRASGDVLFALVQDDMHVLLLVTRSGFNVAEIKYRRTPEGLKPCSLLPETSFVKWYERIEEQWRLRPYN